MNDLAIEYCNDSSNETESATIEWAMAAVIGIVVARRDR
jgi:hypothetical protein